MISETIEGDVFVYQYYNNSEKDKSGSIRVYRNIADETFSIMVFDTEGCSNKMTLSKEASKSFAKYIINHCL